MIAEVIVDVAHSEVDKIFDYLCDDSVQAGCRVTVPFGRTYVAGFVMRIKPTSDFPNLKRIAKVFDELPAINPECLSLTQKIADRYHVPKALVLRLFLPAEMRTGKVSEVYKNLRRAHRRKRANPCKSHGAKGGRRLFKIARQNALFALARTLFFCGQRFGKEGRHSNLP